MQTREKDGRADRARLIFWLSLVWAIAATGQVLLGGLVTSFGAGDVADRWLPLPGSGWLPSAEYRVQAVHQWYGLFAGVATLGIMLGILVMDARVWVRVLAAAIVLSIGAQGLGGRMRVLANSRNNMSEHGWAMIHGLGAHWIMALGGVLLAHLAIRAWRDSVEPGYQRITRSRRARSFAIGGLVLMGGQYLIGAMLRHFQEPHFIPVHVALGIMIVIASVTAGFNLLRRSDQASGDARLARVAGMALVVLVVLQAALGIFAFVALGTGREPVTLGRAMVRTLHQSNGVLVTGALACVCTLGHAIVRMAIPMRRVSGASGRGAARTA